MVNEIVSKGCEQLRMDQTDYRFSLRDERRYIGWGNTRLKIHLARIEELEYLLVHHGGRGQSFVYELVFERSADDDRPVLPVLTDVGGALFHRDAAAGVGEKKKIIENASTTHQRCTTYAPNTQQGGPVS